MKAILFPRFTLFYALLCVLIMAAGHFQLTWTYYLTKPVALLSILFFFRVMATGKGDPLFRNLMLAGFLLSAAGDALLMFSGGNDNFFIAGLAAFLLAHLAYTSAFITQIFRNRPWNQHWGQLAFATLVVVYGAEFFILNRDYFGSLYFPVLFYCMAITLMGIAAVMRDRLKNNLGYFRVVIGSVFFIISDSLLATDKFIFPIENAGLLILGTYFFAQYMIATGCLVDVLEQEENATVQPGRISETGL